MTQFSPSAGEPSARAAPAGLRAIVAPAALGAVLWFLAVLFIRDVGPLGAFRGGWRLVTYAAIWPATWPCVFLACRLADAPRTQALAVVSVASATALFLDGVALAWFGGIYGDDPLIRLGGAAWLLWAVGVALALALRVQARARSRQAG